ncbi:MAG: ATP-binding protein [Acidobacteria bacterium]|nr:ATP-binding protein [Acidobacteriota bacterium]
MAVPPHELLLEICREIVNLVPCDRIDLALPSQDGGTLTVIPLHPQQTDAQTWSLEWEESCCAEVMKRWKTELLPTLGGEFQYSEEKVLYRQGIRDVAFLPLRRGGEPFGVLILGASTPHCLEGRGIRQLERVSGIVALALATATGGPPASFHPDAARGEEAADEVMRGAYRQLASFSRQSSLIHAANDLNEACRLFLQEIHEHSGYSRAILTLTDTGGRDYQWFFTGLSDDEIDAFHTRKLKPTDRDLLLREGTRLGNSYLVSPVPQGERLGLAVRADADHKGGLVLIVPLRGSGERLVGMLVLGDPNSPDEPTAEILSPLELFTSQMAHAIETKHLDQAVKKAEAGLRGAQDQLMQSEKMSAIGQLISGVAHELNNPLAGVIGYAQLLQSSDVGAKEKKNLEKIYSEAIRCQKIVQNLLGFARRHEPEKTGCSLNRVIDSVLELRSYQLQVDDIEVDRRYDEFLPETMLDFHQMQQVILNIINNAHQAMMEIAGRARRLTVETGQGDGVVWARIIDTGPGIAKNRLARIFDSFYTTKSAGKGTGLGLSLSRAIMEDHLGSMAAESVLGEGTTFIIELPFLAQEKEAKSTEAQPQAWTGADRPLYLLVVDDEAILLELLCDFLEGVGHRVDRARNGQEALQLATERDYDLVLSDLKMPGLDGRGLYDRICRKKPAMARRFVFSTGDLANPEVQLFFQRTGAPYLNKPFRLEEVLTVLNQLSGRLQAA